VCSDSAGGCTPTTFSGDRCCYDRAASVPSRGTIMIYLRPHDGRSLRYNANARHLNVLVVPLFPLWIIGAFCVKDSKWLKISRCMVFAEAKTADQFAFSLFGAFSDSSSTFLKLSVFNVTAEILQSIKQILITAPNTHLQSSDDSLTVKDR